MGWCSRTKVKVYNVLLSACVRAFVCVIQVSGRCPFNLPQQVGELVILIINSLFLTNNGEHLKCLPFHFTNFSGIQKCLLEITFTGIYKSFTTTNIFIQEM